MANKISEIFEKIDSQNLEKDAENGNADAQYKFGMSFYEKNDYKNAEIWFEKAFRNENITTDRKQEIKNILKRKEFENLYFNNKVPYSASRMTRGGNSTSGAWSKWNQHISPYCA